MPADSIRASAQLMPKGIHRIARALTHRGFVVTDVQAGRFGFAHFEAPYLRFQGPRAAAWALRVELTRDHIRKVHVLLWQWELIPDFSIGGNRIEFRLSPSRPYRWYNRALASSVHADSIHICAELSEDQYGCGSVDRY